MTVAVQSVATVDGELPLHSVARGFAAVMGLGGAVLSLIGFGLGMAGDPVVSSLTTLAAALALALVGAIGAGLAWWRPAVAAGLLGVALVGLAFALRPLVGPWYDGLLAATATGPVAGNAYWIEAPAMAVFIASGVFMTIAAALSLLATIREVT